MSWETIVGICAMITAGATLLYTFSFFGALRLAYIQTKGFEKNRKLQETLNVFKEIQTPELISERRYVYEHFPEDIEGVEAHKLIAHFRKAELALLVFDRIGYLLQTDFIDKEPMMENYWSAVWRCWKKSQQMIVWLRELRKEPNYFFRFERLFSLAEDYRIRQGYEEPNIYSEAKILLK